MDSMRETRMHEARLPRWTLGRIRPLGLVAAIGVMSFAIACGGDSTGPDESKTPDGTYAMSTVNGKALPAALFAESTYKFEIVSASLVLTTDGKYSTVATTRQTLPDNVSTFVDSTRGTWLLTGAQVQFTDAQDGAKETAAFANGQLTFTLVDGKVTTTIVYAKKR